MTPISCQIKGCGDCQAENNGSQVKKGNHDWRVILLLSLDDRPTLCLSSALTKAFEIVTRYGLKNNNYLEVLYWSHGTYEDIVSVGTFVYLTVGVVCLAWLSDILAASPPCYHASALDLSRCSCHKYFFMTVSLCFSWSEWYSVSYNLVLTTYLDI